MTVKLLRHTFIDDPTWFIIDKNVPLGTEYEVKQFRAKGFTLINKETNKSREVLCYYLVRNNNAGWLPAETFQVID